MARTRQGTGRGRNAAAVCVWLLCAPGLAAQTPTPGPATPASLPGWDRPLSAFSVDLWTEDDGLPQNLVMAIAPTPDGHLWLGLEEGLARFDGVRFDLFDPGNTPAFSTGWVTTLWADEDGTLWVGTSGGGVVRYREGRFSRTAADSLLWNAQVGALFRDRAGRLWIGAVGRGLFYLEDGRLTRAPVTDSLPSQTIVDIIQDREGALWIGTIEGLVRLDPEGEVRSFTTDHGLPSPRVRALAVAPDGSVWIGTTDGGVSRFQDGRFTTYSRDDGLSSDFVMALHVDADGSAWVGTNGGGLDRIRGGQVTTLSGTGRLPGDLVRAMARDAEGNLWMGLTGIGLARVHPGTFTTFGKPEGLSADITLALMEDRRGDLWIGTAGGGLNRVRDGAVTTWTSADGLAHDVVLTLEATDEGDVWVGTVGEGISRIRDGRIRTFRLEDGLASTQVVDIEVDPSGDLWLGTLGSGVQRWRPGGGETFTTREGLPDDWVNTVQILQDGAVWVGTKDGLARIEDGRVIPVEIGLDSLANAREVTSLYQDGDGVVWATSHRGVLRIEGERVDRFGEDAGPGLGEKMHALVPDSMGNFWLSSNDGIFRLKVADLEAYRRGDAAQVPVQRFGRDDGLRSSEANGGINPAGIRRRDGTLWFATMRGAASVDPTKVADTRPVPRPIIQQLVAGDSAFFGPATLPPHLRTFEVHFTAPTFTYPGGLEFRYRLHGLDDDWVSAGSRRAAYYTDLGPGRYRFQVAVRRPGGPWIEGEPLPLRLEARFHETPVFLALLLLAALGLVVGGHRLRIRHLRRRQQELLRLMAERERTEEALRLSEERLRLALDAGRMGTWEWDPGTNQVTASGATAEILGFRPDAPGQTFGELRSRTSSEHTRRLRSELARVSTKGGDLDLHFPITHIDGTRRHVEVRGRAVSEGAGEPSRIAGVVADLTEFMEAQAELRQREEALRQSQKMEAVGRLAGGIAHDFNNLLTAIEGRSHLLLESLGSGDPNREDVDEIRKAAERAAGLTSQLLTFSRKEVPQNRVLDLNRVIADMRRMLRGLIREDVMLEFHLAEPLDAVRADPRGIEQILLNLVLNAQDAMPDGGRVIIETRGGRGNTDTGRVVTLTVEDTGHGMSDDVRRQVFDPFFTTKPVGKGTGLGLSTVYGIVQQSGGLIRLSSTPGKGSRFVVQLPAVLEQPGEGESTPTDHAPGGSETILLVEDEPAVRSLTRKLLERRGYTVLAAASGPDAIEVCEGHDHPIHLLISDVVMPELGGRELAAHIRVLRPDIAVLLMSGYTEDEVLRRGIPGSGLEFLQKPFQASDLLRRVRRLLDDRTRAARP